MTNQPPLSSIVNSCRLSFFLSMGILWEWMRMQMPAKSFLSLLLRAGDVHLGGHILPGWRPSKVIFLPWIWSCMKPENWLRIDLSGDWCLCIALHTCSDACCYWIGIMYHLYTVIPSMPPANEAMIMHSVVFLCVCLSHLCFESLVDLNTSSLVCRYLFGISRSCLCMKVIRLRSRSQMKKRDVRA